MGKINKGLGEKKMIRITQAELLGKLRSLDEKLVNIWLQEENRLSDDEIWEIFVVLLESRVEILKTCRDAGVRLTLEMCLPTWLERIVARKKELRLRDIKVLAEDLRRQKKLAEYEIHTHVEESVE
jgi:hypothetical protein